MGNGVWHKVALCVAAVTCLHRGFNLVNASEEISDYLLRKQQHILFAKMRGRNRLKINFTNLNQ